MEVWSNRMAIAIHAVASARYSVVRLFLLLCQLRILFRNACAVSYATVCVVCHGMYGILTVHERHSMTACMYI